MERYNLYTHNTKLLSDHDAQLQFQQFPTTVGDKYCI